jgi:hypothetical protein
MLAYATWDGSIRIIDLATERSRTLTPDGRRIAFIASPVPEE